MAFWHGPDKLRPVKRGDWTVDVTRVTARAADNLRQPEEAAPARAEGAGDSGARVSRRKWFKRLIGIGAFGVASGAYGREVEPFWLQWHDVSMPVKNLPASFDGFRIAHLTDLHAGPLVPFSYLHRVMDQLRAAKPGAVVVTGDLVHHDIDWVNPICDLLGEFQQQSGIPVITSLGNHDYDVSSFFSGALTRIADALEARLAAHRIPCLRNRSTTIEHGDGRLWFVGLEDLWSGRFSPQIAFANVNTREPVIVLSHNPDTAAELDVYGGQWTLSGHTHGGQVRVPGYGALLLNVQNKDLDQGLFTFPHSHLYVSRGVGYLKQVRVFCRPEVPTFVLAQAK